MAGKTSRQKDHRDQANSSHFEVTDDVIDCILEGGSGDDDVQNFHKSSPGHKSKASSHGSTDAILNEIKTEDAYADFLIAT